MSSEWPVYKVADLEESKKLLVQDGNHGEYRPRKDEFVEDGTAFVRAADLGWGAVKFDSAEKINAVALRRIRKGIGKNLDTILSTKGTVGKIAFVPEGSPQFVCSPQTSFWRSLDPDFLDPKFIYYELQSSHFLNQTSSRKGETDMADYLSLTSQRGLNIRVPDIAVQREVAKVLGSLDDKIVLNRQINQTLEQIAQTLFKSWFVDFEPVKAKIEAKATGRDPERAAMCAISGKSEAELDQLSTELRQQLAASAALFPDALVGSELGLIPEGWAITSVYSVSNVIYGAPFASKKFNSDGIGKPLIRIRDLKNEAPGIHTPEVHPKGYLVQPGDIVVGMDGEFRAYLWGGEGAWLNQRVCVFKPKESVSAAFVRSSIIPCLAAVEASETATTVIHLGKNDIDRFRVVVPRPGVMAAFRAVTDPIYSQIVSIKQSSRTLATLRDTLLPKLLSGELAVDQPPLEARA
jgi:type I restriction enzyme, S subunit